MVICLLPKLGQQTDANKKAVVRLLAYNSFCVSGKKLFAEQFVEVLQQTGLEAKHQATDSADCCLQNLVGQFDISLLRCAVNKSTSQRIAHNHDDSSQNYAESSAIEAYLAAAVCQEADYYSLNAVSNQRNEHRCRVEE